MTAVPKRPSAGCIALLVALSAHAAAQPGGTRAADDSCRAINLVPAFLAFWDEYGKAEPAAQIRMFQARVVEPNRAVYDGVLSGVSAPVPELIARSLATAPGRIGAIRRINQSITTEVPQHIARFRQTFPDFKCTTPVYFLYSLGAFDGAVREVKGTPALMFGVDVIVQTFGDDQAPLFAHELFHVYHRQMIGEGPDELYWALWMEGLATYVSRTLNPGLPESSACCFPDIEAVSKQRSAIAAQLLARLDSVKDEDYRRFMLGGQKDLDIPQRSGYYIGYLIAQHLGERHSLAELARMPPVEVRAAVQRELENMSREPDHS
jgi:hypothetical protein